YGVTEPVEETDVVRRNLYATQGICLLCEKFARLENSFRRAVAVHVIRPNQVRHNIFDPVGYDVILLYWVADIFPRNAEAKLLELFGFLYDLTNFVTELFSAFAK